MFLPVNLLTEVIKKSTWDKLPTNIVVVLLSEGLTLASGAALAQITVGKISGSDSDAESK